MADTLEKFILKALDVASEDERHTTEEAEIYLNAWIEYKETQDIRIAPNRPEPQPEINYTEIIKNNNREDARSIIKELESQIKPVDDIIYTSYPITGPKRGIFKEQWPLDYSSVILQDDLAAPAPEPESPINSGSKVSFSE